MGKTKIFITRNIHPSAVARLKGITDIEIWPENTPPSEGILKEKLAGVNGIITLLTDPISSDVLSASNPSLRVISQMAVGFDNIDIDYATQMKIPVGHTPGVLTETCADFSWALLMALARRIPEAAQEVTTGLWQSWGPNVLVGYDIFGSTLGILGFGRIGQAVARRARGFNMKILYNDPTRNLDLEDELGVEYCPLDELLEQSDFLSIHIFLSRETYHLINKDRLAKMKKTALLINTSRGGIVDPKAIEWALCNKIIAGAALDVFEPEPIPEDSSLLKMKNVLITPHIASASINTRIKMAQMAVDNLIAGLHGERLPFCANPQVYDI